MDYPSIYLPVSREADRLLLRNESARPASCRPALEHLEKIIEENFGFALFQAIERAKCELSDAGTARIRFNECATSLCLDEGIERREFEEINADNFRKIENCIDEVVSQSGLTPAQIDTVSLTGGTSKIPHIQQLFAARFGRDKMEHRNAFTSVAHGLGSSGPLFV